MTNYYSENVNYVGYLENQAESGFEKYVTYVLQNIRDQNDNFLDVGCGTGIVLSMLKRNSPSEFLMGVDINSKAIEKCVEKGLNAQGYDGGRLPFSDNNFRVIGTFNVLEHTTDPVYFLNEMVRVCKLSGFIIIACPNLLAVTNNYHPNTSGILTKLRNLFKLLQKAMSKKIQFRRLQHYTNQLIPDHDAIAETNPIDIIKWSKRNNLKLIYWSSFQYNNAPLLKQLLDIYPLKYILGSCFFVFQK